MNSIVRLKAVIISNDLLKKASGGFIFKAVAIGLNYLFILIITKLYGVDAWGVMAICLSIINILSVFGRMGVDVSVLKFASSNKKNQSAFYEVYFKGFKIIFVLGFIVTFFTYVSSDLIASKVFDKPYLGEFIKVAAFGILPYSLLFLNGQLYRAEEKTKQYFLLVDVFKYLFPILLILLVYSFTSLKGSAVAVYSFVAALYVIVIYSCGNIFFKKREQGESTGITRMRIIKTALPLFLGSSALLIMGWVDTLMIAHYKTESETGIYNILVKFAQVPTIVLIAVNGILAPKISYYFNNGQIEDFRKVINQASKMIFLGSLPVFLLLLLFYPYLFKMFEIEGNNILTVFGILLMGQFINVISGSVALILQMIGKQKIFSNILLIGLFINVTLNFLLIPRFGIEGAAIATTISLICWNLISVFYVYRTTKVCTIYFPKFK